MEQGAQHQSGVDGYELQWLVDDVLPSRAFGEDLALRVGIVTLWLDGPLEGRCVSLGTTPEQLTKDIAAQLEYLLNRAGAR